MPAGADTTTLCRVPSLQHEVLTRVIPLMRRGKSTDDIEALRGALMAQNRKARESPPHGVRKGRQITIANDPGFAVFTLVRSGREPTRTVFYLHGGSYCKPSDPRQWAYAARLADSINARLVFPAYPLGPEFTFRDSHDAMAELFAQTAAVSPDGVVLVGDSAGGGYALSLAQTLRDLCGPQPSHLVLVTPWVDLTGNAPGTREAAEYDPWLNIDLMPAYAGFWVGSPDPADLLDPRASPGLGHLNGLPPALMFSGTRDLLYPACEALFARAEESDWALEFVVAEGLLHAYPLLPIPEAREAFAHAVRFIR
ncbi:MAG: steryl acetyl hydrolase [Marmoricola sp.]|nr:steryl acetyl hydrolase [Marmoricola sp.]